MASLSNATEQDFADLSNAANAAKDAGNTELALRLDEMARKANANITNTKFSGLRRFGSCATISWHDVPSTLL